MTTAEIETRWTSAFIAISREAMDTINRIDPKDVNLNAIALCENGGKGSEKMSEKEEKFLEQRKYRMTRMRLLFAFHPKLKKICENWENTFVDSGFTTFSFRRTINDSFDSDGIYLKYFIHLCGYTLTDLCLNYYPDSQLMPFIKDNCFNLTSLSLRFQIVENDDDFENVFSNMNNLERLSIKWQCEGKPIPMTLVKSLEHVCGTLKSFDISCQHHTRIECDNDNPVLSLETEALMAVICKMTNLESATIYLDHGFTDEFFINLTNNCQNLKSLCVCSSNLTDEGLLALNNLKQLEKFNLGLSQRNIQNKYITDESIQGLFNKRIRKFDISNCIQVTNTGIVELVKNLPFLQVLDIRNTQATSEIIHVIADVTCNWELELVIFVSFEVHRLMGFLKVNQALKFKTISD